MEPLTALIYYSLGVGSGLAAGVVAQSRMRILVPKKTVPDMGLLEGVRWKREENLDLEIIRIEDSKKEEIKKIFNVRLANIARAHGDKAKLANMSIEDIYLDAAVVSMHGGGIREAVIRPDNPYQDEISYIMKKLGVPIRAPA